MIKRLAVLCAALGVAACGSTTAESFAPLPTAIPVHFEDWQVTNYRTRIAEFQAYPDVEGEVVFFGDSITRDGEWGRLFPGVEARNFGIGGDRAEGLLSRYGQIVALHPARIMILIGTNDLKNADTPEHIAFEIDQLLGRLRAELPDTQLVVQSVLPRQPEYAERIRDVNVRLRTVADRRGAGFIDIFTPFVVAGDRLDPSVTQDELHLTPAGYQRWADVIRPCVTEGRCG